MEVEFKTGALADIEFWKRSGNKKNQTKITELLNSIALTPDSGIGKPEKLSKNLSGFWSRRINHEHRIIYTIDFEKNKVVIYSLKGHY
jgi:toxin YoeB